MLAVRSIFAAISVLTLAGAAVAQVATGPAPNPCPTGDCIKHSIQTQVSCTEESHAPAGTQIGWQAGLSTNADQKILGGKIAAYQIRWSTGAWSQWFVPGQNDLDTKYDTGTNDMRRQWAYFGDHEHRYVICR